MKNLILILASLLISKLVFAKEVNIYIDADFSVFKESAEGIELGIKAAIADAENNKVKFNIKRLDHRGNTKRSLHNFKKIAKDNSLKVVFGGLHSPPLITNRKFINTNKLLTLVPWAAGAPITRGNPENNWIYRLSVDDAQAGGFISSWAVNKYKCSKPRLVLENTGWGKSNQRNMGEFLKSRNIKFDLSWFNWGIVSENSDKIARESKKKKNDCVFFVGNSRDAYSIFTSLGRVTPDIKVFSHWGIVGGDTSGIQKLVTKYNLFLQFIQSNFSFKNENLTTYQTKAWKNLQKNFSSIKTPQDIPRESGFVHAYDLTKLLLKALENADRVEDLKKNLENISSVQGLIKVYKKPFSNNSTDKNYHEALRARDYIMAELDGRGAIKLINAK